MGRKAINWVLAVVVGIALLPFIGFFALFFHPWRVDRYVLANGPPDTTQDRYLSDSGYIVGGVVFRCHLRGVVNDYYEVKGPFIVAINALAPANSSYHVAIEKVEARSSRGRSINLLGDAELPVTLSMEQVEYWNPTPGSDHQRGYWETPEPIDIDPASGEIVTITILVRCSDGDAEYVGEVVFEFVSETTSGLFRLP